MNEESEIPQDNYENESFLKKLNVLGEQLGISIEEIKEKRLSKNQLKKLVKNKAWESEKLVRRKIQRDKRKKKKADLIATNQFKPRKIISMVESSNKLKIVIDLSFESLMTDRELQKTFKQVQRCYALNRRFTEPCQLYITSVTGRMKEHIDKKEQSIEKWDVNVIKEHWYDYFKKTGELHKVCYLTSDSPDVIPESSELKKIRDEKIYIIGGLVDHNFHKFLTLGIAREKKVSSAKLPIDKYIQMTMTKVLTINHVFELMLRASAGINWEEAFQHCLPQRKILDKINDKKTDLIISNIDSDKCTKDDKVS